MPLSSWRLWRMPLPARGKSARTLRLRVEELEERVVPTVYGTNLIVNGGAEAGPGSSSGSDIITDIPGWSPSGNFTVVSYGVPGFPSASNPGPANRGQNFFAGGPANAASSATQFIDVRDIAASIDAGAVAFALSAFLGGSGSESDNATVTALFLDSQGQSLGSTRIGPVTASDRDGVTGLLQRSSAGNLFAGTRTIEILLQMTRSDGTYNDGYADNIALVLDDPAVQFSSSSYSVAESAGSATITVTSGGGGASIGGYSVDFATSDGTAVAGVDYVPTSGTLVFGPNETSKTFTFSILDDHRLGPDKTLHLMLSRPSNGATLGAPSQAVLTIVDSDSNGVISKATPLGKVGTTPLVTSQAIEEPTDVDFFSVTVAAGQDVRFNVTQTAGAGFDSFLRLTDAAGNQLAFNDDGPTPGRLFSRAASLTYRFTRAGTYFVGISGYPNFRYNPVTGADLVAGSTGGYELGIFVAPPEIDLNDQIREAKPVGPLSAARPTRIANFLISSPTDVDMFRFVARAGQRVTLAATREAGSSLAAALRLFNGRGLQLAHGLATGSGRRDAQLTFTFTFSGTYYVGVSGRGNSGYNPISGRRDRNGSVGAYSLTLSLAGVQPLERRASLDAALVPIAGPGAQLSGLVYFDQSGDGVRQPSEIGVSRHTVIIDRNHNGVRDDGEPAAFSNARGRYLLAGLPASSSILFAVPAVQNGITIEKITGPGRGFYVLRLRSLSRVSNLVFGMARYEG